MIGGIIGRSVVIFFTLLHSVVLLYLAMYDALDFTRYTYISYVAALFVYIFIVSSWFSTSVHAHVLMYVMPLLIQNSAIIMICVVFMVYNNQSLYSQNIDAYGGTRPLKFVYIGDFLIHYLPTIEAFVIAVCVYKNKEVTEYTKKYMQTIGKLKKSFYIFYFVLGGMFPLILYGAIFNWETYYYTTYNHGVAWICILVVCTAIGTVHYVLLYFS